MDPCTLRILEFDGGGERGLLANEWFRLFVNEWGIEANEVWKYFDIICGTSIGGISALAYSIGLTPTEVLPFFNTQAPLIFTIREPIPPPVTCSVNPSRRPTTTEKVALIGNNDPFYKSGSPLVGPACRNYGSNLLYDQLALTFGTKTLQDANTNVLVPSYEVTHPDEGYGKGIFTLFSNLTVPGLGLTGQNAKMVDVAGATSAAPVYLPAYVFGGKTYLDGGLYCNNPTQLGLDIMQAIKPLANRFCVLSIGTGLGTMQFAPEDSLVPGFDTLRNIFSLFDIASTGAQEAVDKGLQAVASNSLNDVFYYRFQPTLDPTLDTTLDNTSPEIRAYYTALAATEFAADQAAIINFIGHLMV